MNCEFLNTVRERGYAMLFIWQCERAEGGNGRAQGEDAELHEEVPRHQGRQTPGQYQPQVGSLYISLDI